VCGPRVMYQIKKEPVLTGVSLNDWVGIDTLDPPYSHFLGAFKIAVQLQTFWEVLSLHMLISMHGTITTGQKNKV